MRIERSGPAIREALARHAPEECPVFEAELGRALTAATQSFDLAPAHAVLDRWWGVVAVTRANPVAASCCGALSGLVTAHIVRDINLRLFFASTPPAPAERHELLRTWQRLNVVRLVAALGAWAAFRRVRERAR